MKKTPVLLLLALLRVAVIAQPTQTLGNTSATQINNYAVLPDHGYSFNSICNDTTLHFIVNDSLQPHKTQYAWILDNTLISVWQATGVSYLLPAHF